MKDTFDMSGTALLLELGHGLKRNNFTPSEVKSLSEGDTLAQVRLFIRGEAKIEIVRHVIDLNDNPFVPDGWKVEEHKKCGQFEWDLQKVKFHLSPNQMDGKVIGGNNLRKELAQTPVFNANLLDYLLKNPRLIPDEWKTDEKGNTRYIFFWGTIYRRPDRVLCVRYLFWNGGQWDWNSRWLGFGWGGFSPAASLASPQN